MPFRISSAVIEADPAFWPRRAEAPERVVAGPDATEFIDVAFEPKVASHQQPPAALASATTSDGARMEVLMTLERERRAALGGYSHAHAPAGCGHCRRAAAIYRQ